jgi:hypothetical protein
MAEREYYDLVKRFVIDKLKCNPELCWTEKKLGDFRPDVLGIRKFREENEIGRKYEVIAVEVKDSKRNFREGLGQVLSYTDFADKCYLALKSKSKISKNDSEVRFAKKMGIGLIHIKSKRKFKLLLESKNHYSNPNYIETFLVDLTPHRAICKRCQDIFEFGEKEWQHYTFGDSIQKRTSYASDDYLFLCRKCVRKLKKELKGIIKEEN